MRMDYRKDDLVFGFVAGLIVPLILFGGIFGLHLLLIRTFSILPLLNLKKMILISLIPNILLFRYYMLKLKFESSGKGILAVTVIIVLLFFIIFK